MRFSKNHPSTLTYPLTSIPTVETGIVSPVIGKSHNVPAPSIPGDEGFQELVYEVISVRDDVQSRRWPGWFFEKYGVDPEVPLPLRKAGITEKNPVGAAHIVHMDLPLELAEHLLRWAMESKCELSATPAHNGVPFVESIPTFLQTAGANILTALKKAFEVKYYYGRPRPEEVTGIGAKMTHYPEGCPAHPEYVAGHGAVSGATYKAMNTIFNLTDQEKTVVETATKHFAMYRTLAGVHYADANLEGWNLGSR